MSITVMTWNVENLFPTGDGDPPAEVGLYQEKLDFLAGTITVLEPDVVGLQELGPNALSGLQDRLPAYVAAHEGIPDGRGIRVGVLSRIPFVEAPVDFKPFTGPPPIDSVSSIDDAGNPTEISAMGRGAVRVTVDSGGLRIHVMTCHLKSKLLTFPGGFFTTTDENLRVQVAAVALIRRAAEAAEVRRQVNLLMDAHPGDGIILMGDMNDGPDAATSQMLVGPAGSEIGTIGFDRPDQGDATRLFNTDIVIAEERRYSRIHRGVPELLDQVFASEELFPRSVGNNRAIPDVDSIVDFADQLPSIGNNPHARAREIEPDHAPVIATFMI